MTLFDVASRHPAAADYGGVDTSRSALASVALPRLSTAVTVPPVPCTA